MNKKTPQGIREQIESNVREVLGLVATDDAEPTPIEEVEEEEDTPEAKERYSEFPLPWEFSKSIDAFRKAVGVSNDRLITVLDAVEPTKIKVAKVVNKLPNEVPSVPRLKAVISLFDTLASWVERPAPPIEFKAPGPFATWYDNHSAHPYPFVSNSPMGGFEVTGVTEDEKEYVLYRAPWLKLDTTSPGAEKHAPIPSDCVFLKCATKLGLIRGPAWAAYNAWAVENMWGKATPEFDGWEAALMKHHPNYLGSRKMPKAPLASPSWMYPGLRHENDSPFLRQYIVNQNGSDFRVGYIGKAYSAWPQGRERERELIELSLKNCAKVLLIGQPGTGKTEVAFSVMAELGFCPIQQFEDRTSNCVIVDPCNVALMDDIDRWSIGKAKQLLDSLPQNKPVIMTANSVEGLDPALLRPGRVDRVIEFHNPDEAQRELVFRYYLKLLGIVAPPDADVERVVEATEDLTEAYVAQVAKRLAYTSVDVLLEDIEALKRIQGSFINTGIRQESSSSPAEDLRAKKAEAIPWMTTGRAIKAVPKKVSG